MYLHLLRVDKPNLLHGGSGYSRIDNSSKMDGDTTTSTATIASTTMTSSTGTTASSSSSAPIIHAIASPLMHGLKPPGKLHTTGSPADSWKAYKQVWENYSLISGLYAHTEEYKVALFLHCIRTERLKMASSLRLKRMEKTLTRFLTNSMRNS